jgi:glycosyltransferase involved in cell wall biosynthesis
VITPTFNRASFLSETVESVFTQDYPHLEHLVLDDGSTDNTPSLLAAYEARRSGRFRWTRHENRGQARTLNGGFHLARGELLCILNSDDTWCGSSVRRLAPAAKPTSSASTADGRSWLSLRD